MRDQDIREMLYNAEEPVSPGVWSAVAAGLDAKTKRVVPLWMWSAVAFAAAAAVAVGVFIWRPASHNNNIIRLEEFAPASPLAARLENNLSGEIVMPSQTNVEAAQATPVRIAAAPIAQREESSMEAVPDATINPQALLKNPSRLAMAPRSSYVPTVDDNSLINALAWEEERPHAVRDISLTASGNVQANSRTQTYYRRGFAAPAADQKGVYNIDASQDRPGIPLSFGVGVKWNMFPRWAVGTGVRYTFLSRSFVADYRDEGWEVIGAPVDNMQHLIGVPLNIYYDIVDIPRLKVHAFAGGAMDYLLLNKFVVHSGTDIPWRKDGGAFMWSAAAGAGVEYLITKNIGLYLDPSVRYYFGQEGGTDINGLPAHPVRFAVEAGLRFTIGRY